MARVRFIKPGFFTNDTLAEIDPLGRLLFQGLWCIADRAGRLEDRPKRIKAEVLPYDDADVDALLNDLASHGFILRYAVGGSRYIQVVNFAKHQSPHVKEAESIIPASDMSDARLSAAPPVTVTDTVTYSATDTEDHLPPTSPTTSKRDVVTDASASSRDDFFSEDDGDDLSFLDAPEDKHDTSTRAQAQPANITPHPTLTARAATLATTSQHKDKPTPKARTTWTDDSEPMRLACYLKVRLQAVNPDVRVPPNLNAWASEFDKMIRLDEREYDGIKRVIDFATSDSFWQTNVLSANAVRRQYARLAQIIRNKQQQGENYHNGHTGHYAATGTEGQSSGRASTDGGGQGTLSTPQGTRSRTTSGIHQPDSTRHGIYAHLVE